MFAFINRLPTTTFYNVLLAFLIGIGDSRCGLRFVNTADYVDKAASGHDYCTLRQKHV